MIMKRIVATALLAGSALAATSASATRLHIVWSGASYGNSATATGDLDFLYDHMINDTGHYPIDDWNLLDVSITITGAAQGNGTYGRDDFSYYVLNFPIGLNYDRELIGQNVGHGYHFGDNSPYGGAFLLFGNPLSPVSPFVAWAPSGEKLRVVSMQYGDVISVPEPASWAMMIGGFGMVGAAMRRRKVRVSFG